jgi:hypothetical protein
MIDYVIQYLVLYTTTPVRRRIVRSCWDDSSLAGCAAAGSIRSPTSSSYMAQWPTSIFFGETFAPVVANQIMDAQYSSDEYGGSDVIAFAQLKWRFLLVWIA